MHFTLNLPKQFGHQAGRCLYLAAACLVCQSSFALTLNEAVALARGGDPAYLGAQATLAIAKERATQAFSTVLPQVNATGNANVSHRVYTTDTIPSTTYDENFNGKTAQVSLTQPLWRTANRVAITQSNAAVAQAEYQLAAADQDLLLRLSQAWFDVLLAHDQLTFTEGQVIAAKHEWDQLARAAELGIVGKPVAEEARMKHEQAVSERAAAESEQAVKFGALEQVIGPTAFPTLPTLSDQYLPVDSKNDTLERWLGVAESDSPAIRAALSALEAANEEIRKQRAGFEPTLDLTGSYGKNQQGTGTYGGQAGYNSTTSSVGLQFNLPIYSGGGQGAKVREAIAAREKALQELESSRRTARNQSKQAWYGWQASQSRLLASQQAIQYSVLNLQSALAGMTTGVKKELDVLKGRQQLYGALRDQARARYEITLNQFRLKAAAGQLQNEDLVGLDKWLNQPSKGDKPSATP